MAVNYSDEEILRNQKTLAVAEFAAQVDVKWTASHHSRDGYGCSLIATALFSGLHAIAAEIRRHS